jgi:hypothetical protein
MAKPSPEEFLPLPLYVWLERPATLELDVDEVATALYLSDGNLAAAADLLKVVVGRLRKPIRKSRWLQSLIEQLRAP